MKLSEQEIEKLQQQDWQVVNKQLPNGVNPNAYRLGYLKGFQQAQSLNGWVSCQPSIDIATADRLDEHDDKLIMCLYDNGDVLRFDEEQPFAILTHVYFFNLTTNQIK